MASEVLSKRKALSGRIDELKRQMKELDKRKQSFGKFMGVEPTSGNTQKVTGEPSFERKKKETCL